MTDTLLIILAVLIAGLNVFATLVIVRSPRYEIGQKWFQAVLIWFVPVIGAVLAWSLAKDSPIELVTTDVRDRLGNGSGDGRVNSAVVDIGSGNGGGSGD